MRLAGPAFLLLVAASARASSISDQISAGTSQATPQNPRAGSVSNLLRASMDLGEQWTLSADAQITLEEPTPAPPGAAAGFQDRGGTVTDFSASLDWDVTDNWTVGGTLGISPQSTTGIVAPVTVIDPSTGRQANADGLIRVVNSSGYVELVAGYDTAGESSLEWSFMAGISLNRFETRQRLEQAQLASGRVITLNQLRTSGELRSARLSGGITATLFTDTDVTLNGDYYGYADDPAGVGYFSIAGPTRNFSSGAGVPIAPLHYLIRPELLHRFGDFSLRLWAQAGRYMPGTGQTTAGVGLKGQYKLTRSFKMWASASGQNDVDSSSQSSKSGTFALGTTYRF